MATLLVFDEAELERRRNFFEISDADLERLASLRGFAEKANPEVVEDLYRLILGHEESRKFFKDEATLTHVKRMQGVYFLGLFSGRLDLDYVKDRLRVGVVHERIGMPLALYLGTYGRYLRAIHARLACELPDPKEVWESYVCIEKRVRFDESLAVDTYIEAQHGHLRDAAALARELTERAEIARARAEKSEGELRDVAEFRERFIGILGHDLRNPLSAIIMASGILLQRGHLNEEDAKTTARITTSGQRMRRMIGQMLDLTRARLSGGLAIDVFPADISEICHDVVEEFEAPIQLQTEGDLTGTWDKDRLSEVFSNLVGNAIEYAAPGTSVTVKAYSAGAEVVVEIGNQGQTIPADVRAFIFEPFRRADQGVLLVRRDTEI